MRVVATAGHVDHGKSSLVRRLTGTDPDRFAEERERGLTIDLGFAHTTLASGVDVGFVDVPGHVRFVANMLAGVGGADVCLFVVAANEGWMPQSEEHLRILDLLGIERGLVVLTKTDLVDADLVELAGIEVAERVAGTFLERAPVVPISSTTGEGIEQLRAALDDLLALVEPPPDRGRARLWVDRSFAARGAGTVVTGTLLDGRFAHDDTVVVEPGGQRARIRAMQSLGRTTHDAAPGTRVALNLNGVDHHEVSRGDVVVTPGSWHLTDTIDADLTVLASLDHRVSRRGAYVAYIGSGETPATMRVLGDEEIAPGDTGFVRLHLQRRVAVLPGDRYILRESGRSETVGGGEILDIDPQLRARDARPSRSVERVIAERGWVDVDEIERLTGDRVDPVAGRWVAAPALVDATLQRLTEAVDGAGDLGLELAVLDDPERALLDTLDTVVVDGGRARPADAVDPFLDHPVAAAIRRGGFTPDAPDDRGAVRELVARGVLVERDGVTFHRDAIDDAARVAASLLAADPAGFTVAEFRDATATSRKFALALVAELDQRGVTRRRGDLRVAGPRLPSAD